MIFYAHEDDSNYCLIKADDVIEAVFKLSLHIRTGGCEDFAIITNGGAMVEHGEKTKEYYLYEMTSDFVILN